MARKRTTLPKDFADVLESGDVDAMKAVFDLCEIDACGGYSKKTALAFHECPDELARWLVEQGADLEALDKRGKTPLHNRAEHWQGRIETLLELGARVDRPAGTETPLHGAARVLNHDAARLLLDNSARCDVRNSQGLTPLGLALQQCSNASLERLVPLVELLLECGAKQSKKPGPIARIFGKPDFDEARDPALQAMVKKLGETFEFHRASFNPASVDAASASLDRLYELFSVDPVPRRDLHPMDKPIPSGSSNWQERHEELWKVLVPGNGAAPSVQGEVVRISGRIVDELERNGGINWDTEYRLMADALLQHLSSGLALDTEDLEAAGKEIDAVKRKRGQPERLAELAVRWVERNPHPIVLADPSYKR